MLSEMVSYPVPANKVDQPGRSSVPRIKKKWGNWTQTKMLLHVLFQVIQVTWLQLLLAHWHRQTPRGL